jgi:hypothetical protein
MANKITYTNKVSVNPETVAINQWRDNDANEVKTKHNLNDDRITALENDGGLANVVEDTTPQLGGALDLNGFQITSSSATDIVINAAGEEVQVLDFITFLGGFESTLGGTLNGDLIMTSNKISSLANGTASTDAVNKGQLDLKTDASSVVPYSGAITNLDLNGKILSNVGHALFITYVKVGDATNNGVFIIADGTGYSSVNESTVMHSKTNYFLITKQDSSANQRTVRYDFSGLTIASTSTIKFQDKSGTMAFVGAVKDNTGTTKTLALADANEIVTMNNASANTLTIPANSSVAFPIGTVITLINLGAGTTTVGITTDTLNKASAISDFTLLQNAKRTITKVTATRWIFGY